MDFNIHVNMNKIVLSSPTNTLYENRRHARIDVVRGSSIYQASMFTKTQVFHKNMAFVELTSFINELFGSHFTQLHAWCNEYEYSSRITKKGKVLTTRRKISPGNVIAGLTRNLNNHAHSENFNKQKNYIIEEGADIPVLYDMGIFTQSKRIASGMGDKFRQVNRFVELIADEVKKVEAGMVVNVVDFGCGKSYLTFVIHHYLTQIRKLEANICGLDLSEDVINKCTAAAHKHRLSGLTFHVGDIGSLELPPFESWGLPNTFNIVISLHACDTATDYALDNAVKWNADLIYAVPCCHKELNKKLAGSAVPGVPQIGNIDLLTKHGIIKERFAALLTDALRAEKLENSGYKTQVLEFIDFDATPKNLLIRAIRKGDRPRSPSNKF